MVTGLLVITLTFYKSKIQTHWCIVDKLHILSFNCKLVCLFIFRLFLFLANFTSNIEQNLRTASLALILLRDFVRFIINEPCHEKTGLWESATREDSNQSAQARVLKFWI